MCLDLEGSNCPRFGLLTERPENARALVDREACDCGTVEVGGVDELVGWVLKNALRSSSSSARIASLAGDRRCLEWSRKDEGCDPALRRGVAGIVALIQDVKKILAVAFGLDQLSGLGIGCVVGNIPVG